MAQERCKKCLGTPKLRFVPPDREKLTLLERELDGRLVYPAVYSVILDVCEGRFELIPCPCVLKERIAPPPLVRVTAPKDYEDPPPRFSSFKVSEGNRDAFLVCQGWVRCYLLGEWLPTPLLSGPVGTGKTRLLWTIAAEIAAGISEENLRIYERECSRAEQQERVEERPKYRKFSYKYVSVPKFADTLRNRCGLGISDYRDSLVREELLLLDDLGAENITDFVREQLYLLLDERVTRRLPTIVACNFTASEIGEWLGDRLRSRLLGNSDLVEMSGPDMRGAEKARRASDFVARTLGRPPASGATAIGLPPSALAEGVESQGWSVPEER